MGLDLAFDLECQRFGEFIYVECIPYVVHRDLIPSGNINNLSF